MLWERIKADYADDGDALVVTALRDEALFRQLLAAAGPIDTVVETGTNRGFSALVLEEFCQQVHTFDVKDYPHRQEVFDRFSKGRLRFHHIHDDAAKAAILAQLKFDFAFVDGNHYKVADDFALVETCGRVLFHDYSPGFPPENQRSHVVRFVDGLLGIRTKQPPFAYWIADE